MTGPDLSRPAPPVLRFTPEDQARIEAVLAEFAGRYRRAVVVASRACGQAVARHIAEVTRATRMLRTAGVLPPPEPTSARDRALRARQNRHTGPRGNPHRHRGR